MSIQATKLQNINNARPSSKENVENQFSIPRSLADLFTMIVEKHATLIRPHSYPIT